MASDSKQGHVYTLLLEGGNYYVGWSAAAEARIAQHFCSKGSEWTKMHRPVRVLACVPGDKVLENVTTTSLMCQHGWERVRGGPWCQLHLEGPPKPVQRAMKALKVRPEGCTRPAEPDSTAQVNPDGEPASPKLAQQEMKEERESIRILRIKADGEPRAWRAEVRNAEASKECTARGFKCIYAATLQEVTARICDWRQACTLTGSVRSPEVVLSRRRETGIIVKRSTRQKHILAI
jgi:hypothetical protein